MSPKPEAIVIGSGIGGLASACLLAKNGWNVTVIEKNNQLGGRVGLIKEAGFRFDSGASWLLMKDVIARFFSLLGEDLNSHLSLTRLDPSFRTFFSDGTNIDIRSDINHDSKVFDRIEPGSSISLKNYLSTLQDQYQLATRKFMYKDYSHFRNFFSLDIVRKGIKLSMLSNLERVVGGQFTSQNLRQLMGFSALFLGTRPSETPALYGILNHALLNQGVFYPSGGIYSLVEALESIARKHGVKFKLNSPVKKIIVKKNSAKAVYLANGKQLESTVIISNADRYHTEQDLLDNQHRSISNNYWDKAAMAPSALLMYLGIKGKLPQLTHHNLVFGDDWTNNFQAIFDKPMLPKSASFYICNPSKSDSSVAPKEHENLFVLSPLSTGMDYTHKELGSYANKLLERIESRLQIPDLRKRIVLKKVVGKQYFTETLNSFRGSALGLSHTLRQTAVYRPKNFNRKVKNLYYVGAYTNPGIGIPPALISAELAYKRILSHFKI